MSDIQVKEQSQETVLHELRNLAGSVDSLNNLSAEQKSAYDQMNAQLDKYEEKSQQLSKEIASKNKEIEELKSGHARLEAMMCEPSFGSLNPQQHATLKAYETALTKGVDNLNEVELKYLRTDNNADGGFLVPVDYDNDIIKQITEFSPVRQIARVRTMGFKSTEMPVRSTLISSAWVGEGEEDTTSQSQYGQETLYARKLQVTCAYTREMLDDASPNIVNEISSDVAEEFARLEGNAFVNGDGVEKPEGFMFDSRVAEINSGSASTISFDNFASLEGELKTGYNAVFGFNRRTLAIIRNLKDGAGAYIWRAGNLGAGVPNNINGSAYYEMPDMPDVGAGLYPIIYGDFLKGYLIGDRSGITIIRDDYTQKKKSKIEITFNRRVGGKVMLPEAFVKLKVSA